MKNLSLQHIEQLFAHKKIVVACSGGLDSMVLLHILHSHGVASAVAHCNFNLRGEESDEDASFVATMAEKYDLPYYSEIFNTKAYAKDHKISTQMAARDLRYTWFSTLLETHNYDLLATAHHADDNLETFLINLSRGSGLMGLTGIPEITQTLIRPLLPFSRAEILAYAKENNLHWREDSSNKSTHYLRNDLRHTVVVPFKKATKKLLPKFNDAIHHLKSSQLLVDDYMALVYNTVVKEIENGYEIDIKKLQGLPNTKALLFELLQPFGFTAWTDVYELLTAQSGKFIKSKTHRLLKNREELILTKIETNDEKDVSIDENFRRIIKISETQIETPIKMSFIPTNKMGFIDSSVVYVDGDALSYPLTLRKWERGDVFKPFGMKGNKKISKFFKDEKLSLAAKEKVWLLCDSKRIVWVVNYRLDDRYKVTDETKNILKITTTPTR